MADMYYKDEFNELFTIKDRVKQALEESESSICTLNQDFQRIRSVGNGIRKQFKLC